MTTPQIESEGGGAARAGTVPPPPPAWYALRPDWYRLEVERLSRRYPGFVPSAAELRDGVLAFAGVLTVDSSGGRDDWPVLLVYGDDTPAHPPSLFPLTSLPPGDDWRVDDWVPARVRRLQPEYRRHQGPTGWLCVVEADAYNAEERIPGDEVLRRAEAVFAAATLGLPVPFADTAEADLDAYFRYAGDIALGPAFYADALAGPGTWNALPLQPGQTPGGAALTHDPNAAHPLWIGARLSTTGPRGVVEIGGVNVADPEVFRAFPWAASAAAARELRGVIGGGWYDMPAEPPPLETGGELAALLETAGVEDARGVLAKLGPRRVNDQFVALRYPRRDGAGRDWLFLRLEPKETLSKEQIALEGDEIWREVMAEARVSALRAHAIVRPELELRSGPGTPRLHGRRVAVVGCGALGSDVAVTLAKAGVGTLVLVDGDFVRPGNVVRHAAGLWATGMLKVDAVRRLVHQHNPFVAVEVVSGNAGQDADVLDQLLRTCDLVVSTVANENAEAVLNEAAVRLGRAVVYGRALRGGSAARVFRVRPGEDACKACLALYRREAAEEGAPGERPEAARGWIDLPPVEGELLGRECGNPILAGSAADLRFAADLTARAVLDELDSGVSWNSLVWTREPLPDISPNLARPYAADTRLVPPHPRCGACRRPRTAAVVIAESAHRALVAQVEAHPSAETGGVLVGYRDVTGTVVVLEATDAGPAALESPVLFERDADYVQARLVAANHRLGPRGQYAGEWHSHLEPNPRPSPRDIQSLAGIAAAPSYLNDEPIMLIAGLDPKTGEVMTIDASCFPLGMRMHERALTIEPDNVAAARAPAIE